MQLSRVHIKPNPWAFAIYLGILFCLGSLLPACQSSDNDKKLDVSPEAKKILKRADTMHSSVENKEILTYLDSAYNTLKQPTAVDLYAKYSVKGMHYLKNYGDTLKAHVYADSMSLVLSGKENKYKLRYAKAIFFKGDVFFAEMNYNQAFELYYKGREFAMKNLDSCEFFEFTYRIGMVKYRQERYLGAISYIKRAFNESKHCSGVVNGYDVYTSRQGYLNTIGICFEKVNLLDSAVSYYKKSLEFLEKEVPRRPENVAFREVTRGIIYGNLGGVYVKLNNIKLGEEYLKKSIDINDNPDGDRRDARTAKIKLASLYIQTERLQQAKVLINQLDQESDWTSQKIPVNIRMDMDRVRADYYGKTGNYLLAYQHMQRYNYLRDSVFKSNTNLMRSDIDAAFKVSEQNYQISLLDKDTQIKKIYIFSFAVLSVVAFGVLILVLQNRKRLEAVNAKISAQNADMQMTLKVLEQSQKENTLMMKIAAHDLRSPISAVINVTEVLRSSNPPAEHVEILELLEDLSHRSLETIDSLLNINFDTENLVKEPVEMSKFLLQCVNLLKFKATDKKQRLELSTLPVVIDINKEKIWRLFSNLIYNAIKFSPYGSQINIGMSRENGYIVFFVRDFGIGIPTELQDKIFDIFTEAKRFGTLGEHPVGLGLAISKQIVQAHNGEIWFESTEGKGTTFFVKLPANKNPDEI